MIKCHDHIIMSLVNSSPHAQRMELLMQCKSHDMRMQVALATARQDTSVQNIAQDYSHRFAS